MLANWKPQSQHYNCRHSDTGSLYKTLDRSRISFQPLSDFIELYRVFFVSINPIPMQKPLQNQLLVATDRYVIDSILDPGGVGTICLAKDTRWQQSVVIKLLKEPLLNSPEVYQLFQREIELRTDLNNAHIAKILDSGVNAEGYPFYVMEYLQGESLEWKLQREKQFLIERVICIVQQICLALETVYRRADESGKWLNLCPQNPKPSHIFLVPTPTGEAVKIIDCGITQKVRNYCKESQSTNLMNLLQGSFHYTAPEQLELKEETDCRADIYILGIMLYEMLSGTDPFGLGFNARVVNEVSWIRAHTSQTPPPLHLLLGKSQASLAVSAIVSRCLQKNPDDRYASIQSLQEALEQVDPSNSSLVETAGNSATPQMIPQAIIEESSDDTVIQSPGIEPTGTASFYPNPQLNLPAQQPEEFTILQAINPVPASESNDNTVIQSLSIQLTSETDALQPSPAQFDLPQEQPEFKENPYPPTTDGAHGDTILQYSDSAIHNPGEHTICQKIVSSAEPELDQTVYQFSTPHHHLSSTINGAQHGSGPIPSSQISLYPNFYQSNSKHPDSFLKRFTSMTGLFFNALRRLVKPGKWTSQQLPSKTAATGAAKGMKHGQQPTTDKVTPEPAVSPEQYHKTLRELDHCRLFYAKELARSGKFREAIAMARNITDTSQDYKNAQTLIQSWERF
jgi:eukaryotic-like serine/threonine-protein kinase